MRYCQYCGTQVIDGASFCTSCGKKLASAPVQTYAPSVPTPPAMSFTSPIEPIPTARPATTVQEPKLLQPRVPSTGLHVMNFLFRLFAGFVIFLILLSIGNADIEVHSSLIEGYYSNNINSYAYFYPAEDPLIFAFLAWIPTLVFSIICFVKTLTHRLSVSYIFSAILKLLTVGGLFIWIFGIIG